MSLYRGLAIYLIDMKIYFYKKWRIKQLVLHLHLNLLSTMNHEMARLRAFQLVILNSHRADWFWGAGPAAAGYDFLHHQVTNNAMLTVTFLALDFYQCFKERMDGNVVLNNRARLHLQCCWRQWLEEII